MTTALEPLLVAAELLVRHVYWRSPYLQRARSKRKPSERARIEVDRDRLRDRLEEIGVVPGALVMLHSSTEGVSLRSEAGKAPIANPVMVANGLLRDLVDLVGADGTLTMPTHPAYPGEPGFMSDKSGLVFRYDPRRTPSRVGILTEIFRRRPGVGRSRHPLSPLACRGPLAEELLRGNLNEHKPLPHGAHSPYYRFCEQGGLVVSIGVPLIKYLTVLHVAEEVRDETWPVAGFFYERKFLVASEEGDREWIVRERGPKYSRSVPLGKVRRDLTREGILHETVLAGLRLDWARAGDIFAMMQRRNANSTYPYYLPRLAAL